MRIPVTIHPMFWLFAGLIGWLNSMNLVGTLVWVVVILVSLLVHEFGHALTARAFGQEAQIELMFFGGRTMHNGKQISRFKEFILTLNGPLAGFLLCGVAFAVLQVWEAPPAILLYGLHITVIVNAFWTVLNLLPIMPLDGGQLLRIVLESIFGARGLSYSLFVGMVLGGCAAVAGFVFGQWIIGAVFLLLTFESGRAWRAVRHLSEEDRDVDLQGLFREAEELFQGGDEGGALSRFEQVRRSGGNGLLHVAATEGVARILEGRGEVDEAYAKLQEVEKRLPGASLPLLHRLAYNAGDVTKAAAIGTHAYQVASRYDVAYINALAYATLGEAQAAIGWLKCALREGMPNGAEALQDSAFDPFRDDPHFQQLTDRLNGS
jgi:stage IV sporulation protein FB